MSDVAADLPLLTRSLQALAAVLALLLGGHWMLARQGMGSLLLARRNMGLTIAGTLPLDTRNRLVVIRRGEAELILAIGPKGISKLDFPRSSEGPACGP